MEPAFGPVSLVREAALTTATKEQKTGGLLDRFFDRLQQTGKADQSLDQQAEKIRGAWDEAVNTRAQPSAYSYCTEIYSDHVIVRAGDEYYSIPYAIAAQGGDPDAVTFDVANAKVVERSWTETGDAQSLPVTVSQSGGEEVEAARVRIQKADDERQIVFGWANVATDLEGRVQIDSQGDWIHKSDLEDSVYVFNLAFRDMDVEHDDQPQGHLVESVFVDEDKMRAMVTEVTDAGEVSVNEVKLAALKSALPQAAAWMGFYIPDRDLYEKCKPGPDQVYGDFSIGGLGVRKQEAPHA